jgi:hypothetical protein
MNLKTIVDKINDGTKLLLTIPTLLFVDRDNTPLIESSHYVSEYEEGRPDLIAAKYYGDPSALDIILKYNNISNPFSIKAGEELMIPVREIRIKKFERPNQVEENLVKKQFVDSKRLSAKDKRRVKALQKKYGKDELLPPNVIPTGKKTFKFERGKIVFGKQAQSDPVAEKIQQDISRGRVDTEITAFRADNIEQVNIDDRVSIDRSSLSDDRVSIDRSSLSDDRVSIDRLSLSDNQSNQESL